MSAAQSTGRRLRREPGSLFVSDSEPPVELSLLSHHVTHVTSAAQALVEAEAVDVVMVDGRTDLAGARSACQTLAKSGGTAVLLLVATSGLAVLSPDWGFNDFVAGGSEPAELDARLRILAKANVDPDVLSAGPSASTARPTPPASTAPPWTSPTPSSSCCAT